MGKDSLPKRILLALFMVLIKTAAALPNDCDQPLDAWSQQAEFQQNSLTAFYVGHVMVTQGSTTLNSDYLTVILDPDHQIHTVLASGLPATYRTVPKLNRPPLVATAKEIEYHPKIHQVILRGDAFVKQGEDSYQGQLIYYDTLSQVVTSPPLSTGNRTTIIIQPKQKL